jgi:hypothetical protein
MNNKNSQSTKESPEFINTWKFDVRNKSDIGFWFASESEEVKVLF